MPPQASTPETNASEPGGPGATKGTSIAHIGIAVSALAQALPFYRDVLGMPEVPLAHSDGALIAAVASGESLVELLEPADPNSPIGKFLTKRGAGIHHICFAVADLNDMMARCRAAGVRLIYETPRLGAEGKRIVFLHPASTGGVLVELTEY
ncbi:MAG: methylmalonyl-CoA epimerase [Gemmatimonadaceae bacterium]